MRGITVLASKGGAIATGLAPVLAGGLRQHDAANRLEACRCPAAARDAELLTNVAM